MPNTANGYRYPASTDPVSQTATAIQNLATDADTKAGASASGRGTANGSGGSTATVTVTFPAGRFTAAPNVVACPMNSLYLGATSAVSATSVDLTVRRWDNAAIPNGTSCVVAWIART